MVPLKQKTGPAVATAFQNILTVVERLRKSGSSIQSSIIDVKSLLESKSCSLYSTGNEETSTVVERWNSTMKEKMFKYFSANSTRKYTDVLDKMVNDYNNAWHLQCSICRRGWEV